ncbi:hypothetical protein P170DRAFT_37652 [Aspergillus steynii IBT 23096]|uniref:Uncharacterized protein n=1 Tax=Aspergillus steynii IBT 23096 TaxID=1392250 RepID=A0A2I2GR08_9EURO|nr:uncharacterized protein P170DRAFT_37652 [Aspergillus steynii IBT 23096]PLB55303.1 hypothetical protein P170DRAFT_37652 [Aspergillus steynii IBT 23096]
MKGDGELLTQPIGETNGGRGGRVCDRVGRWIWMLETVIGYRSRIGWEDRPHTIIQRFTNTMTGCLLNLLTMIWFDMEEIEEIVYGVLRLRMHRANRATRANMTYISRVFHLVLVHRFCSIRRPTRFRQVHRSDPPTRSTPAFSYPETSSRDFGVDSILI